MKLKTIIEKINNNQELIHEHGKLSPEVLKKINYKFRLDWNYYSNRMEGGTLTREETRSVMVGNIDVQGKPLKDVMEMTGHDGAVLDILKLGKGEQRISEKRIKEIHRAIMHEDNPEKKKEIGEWKSTPNEIINYKNEKISFTQPSDVKEAVHKILNETNAELDGFFSNKKTKHPLEIATQFHIDFVSVHPFYDGNGRTTRILTNLILVSCGFPPIIIKDNQKNSYYQLLADIQAYGGDQNLFMVFIGERIIDSQQLILDAIEGKSIEDEDDLDKEIDLFKKRVSAEGTVGTIKKDSRLIAKLFLSNFNDLFEIIEQKHALFDDLFAENILNRMINNSHPSNYVGNYVMDKMRKVIDGDVLEIYNIELLIYHKAYQKDGLNLFDVYHRVTIKFDNYQFFIGDNYQNKWSATYGEPLSVIKLKEIANKMVKSHFENIQAKISDLK